MRFRWIGREIVMGFVGEDRILRVRNRFGHQFRLLPLRMAGARVMILVADDDQGRLLA